MTALNSTWRNQLKERAARLRALTAGASPPDTQHATRNPEAVQTSAPLSTEASPAKADALQWILDGVKPEHLATVEPIAREVLGEWAVRPLGFTDDQTIGQIVNLWYAWTDRADTIEARYHPRIQSLKDRLAAAKGKGPRQALKEALEDAVGESVIARQLCEQVYAHAQEVLAERLNAMAAEKQLDEATADDICCHVSELMSERRGDSFFDITLGELIAEVFQEHE